MDPTSIVRTIWIAADVGDDNVDAFELRLLGQGLFHGGREEDAADAAGVGERFERGEERAESAADVVGWVDFAPFCEGGGGFGVKTLKADIEVFDRGGKVGRLESVAHGGVGVRLGCVVCCMEFLDVGKCGGENVKLFGLPHNVPGPFEDEDLNGWKVGKTKAGARYWNSWRVKSACSGRTGGYVAA